MIIFNVGCFVLAQSFGGDVGVVGCNNGIKGFIIGRKLCV